LEVIHFLRPFSTDSTKLSPKITRIATFIALVLLFALYIVRTTSAIFQEWPADGEVRFVWQEAFTEIAGYLDESDSTEPIAIGGWTPATMDPPTIDLTLVRQDLDIRFFDPTQSLILPIGDGQEQTIRVARPAELPLDHFIEEQLVSWGVRPEEIGSFTLYEVTFGVIDGPEFAVEVNFGSDSRGDELTYLGYDLVAPCVGLDSGSSSILSTCELITYWRVDEKGSDPRRIFLHALDETGTILVQDDGLGAPAEHWVPGDLILQRHTLDLSQFDENVNLRLGVYDPRTGIRLLTADGRDFIVLALVE
jgi:hypothetical protein